MSASAQALPDLSDELLIGPSAETWHAMSPAEREAFIVAASEHLEREALLMPPGRRHERARVSTAQVLEDYFHRAGRQVYVASDLLVVYPYERSFAPDLLVVLDTAETSDLDARTSWVVATEGKGLDLVLEICNLGDREKDFLHSVSFYARLGISEYFIYDRLKQQLLGYRLPAPGVRHYQPIPSRGGLLVSRVLGLDLAIAEGKLRFFANGAMVPETAELLDRVNAMLDERQERLYEEATARALAEAARAKAEEQRAEAERRLETEIAARLEAEAARAQLEVRVAELLARIGEG